MENKLRIGIDIHGVMDSNIFFKIMARIMLAEGHEIHIITGSLTKKAKKDLQGRGMVAGINYTTIFSIADTLLERGIEVTWKDPDNPVFPDDDWNQAKAIYCEENEIDIHFDDSDIYGLYFTTPYAQIK